MLNRPFPLCARFLRNVFRSQKIFIIQNNIGIFEVIPFNDSMTISADYFEAELLHWIDKPKQKRIFVDIGANIGRYTIVSQKRFHYQKVLAIEANPITFSILQKNIGLNTLDATTTLVQIALSDHNGTVSFESDENNLGGAHVVTIPDKNPTKNRILEIRSQKASEVIDAQHIAYQDIDFIKIDVEGFEYEVLSGMENVLRHMRAGSYIMIEISGNKTHDTKAMLNKYLFNLVASNKADHLYVKQ